MTEYLQSLKQQLPSSASLIDEIDQLYAQKLWYNITERVTQLVASPELDRLKQDQLSQLYTSFLAKFENKINALSLAFILIKIISHFPNQDTIDPESVINFLQTVVANYDGSKIQDEEEKKRFRSNLKKEQLEAELVLQTEQAFWMLKRKITGTSDSKQLLRKLKEQLDKLGYVDPRVQAHYYFVKAEFLKRTEDLNEFYKHALLYLAYVPLEELPLIKQQALAFDIGIAALLGDSIYNFGELLGHPIIDSLKGSPAEWLYKMLFAFNSGNIQEYMDIQTKFAHEIQNRDVLRRHKTFLDEKIQIMSIMEYVFQKPVGQRSLHFNEIAAKTGRQVQDVEFMLLRALGHGLMRGTIDEVNQVIHVNWVQPRVLDKKQVGMLKEKVGQWLKQVETTIEFLKQEGESQIM